MLILSDSVAPLYVQSLILQFKLTCNVFKWVFSMDHARTAWCTNDRYFRKCCNVFVMIDETGLLIDTPKNVVDIPPPFCFCWPSLAETDLLSTTCNTIILEPCCCCCCCCFCAASLLTKFSHPYLFNNLLFYGSDSKISCSTAI